MLVAACAMADVCTKLHTERCPSHKGQLCAAHPQQLQPRVFFSVKAILTAMCLHLFPFRLCTWLIRSGMEEPGQSWAAQELLSLPTLFWAAFWKAVPWRGAVLQAAGINLLCLHKLGSVLLCRAATQGLSYPSHTRDRDAFPSVKDGGSFYLLRLWTLPFSMGYPLSLLPQVWNS